MYLHPFDNGSTRPPPPPRGQRGAPPPPPAPPSTPVIKQHPIPATQKYHHQLLQQLPKMLANGVKMSKPEDFVWVDPSGRPTTPPRPKPSKNQAQHTRKVRVQSCQILNCRKRQKSKVARNEKRIIFS